jgi:hypothetical protein
VSFPVCLGAVPEDVRVRALAAGRADEDAVSLVPGSFEAGKGVGQPAAEMTLIVAAHACWSCPAWQA